MTGAATFTAQAAMKTGSGLAILGIPSSLHSIVASKLTEVMTTPLAETASHTFGLPAEPFILEKIKWADVIAMGPGLSQNEETQKLVKKLLKNISKPVVLDADALNALGNESHLLKKVAHCIITPHPGEFARLFGISSQEVLDRGIQIAREKAQELEIIIVLKGAPTVIASPDGEIYINSTGNPGMATGGAGDVLTGMIGSLIGQGLSIKEAAITGVYVHGLAGDLAKQDKGEMGMTAMDILENIPAALIRAGHSF
jgi:NAD(P)H-hydrate epimerase